MPSNLSPSNTLLKAFNGDSVSALGEVHYEFLIDEVHIKMTAVLTDVDLGGLITKYKNVNTKLQVIYSGLYIVMKVLNNGRYEIRKTEGMRGYNILRG